MATLTFTINVPNAHLPRLIAALKAQWLEDDGEPNPSNEDLRQMVEQRLRGQLKRQVIVYERSIQTTPDIDIT